MSKHPLRDIWTGMLRRCRDPKCKGYLNYGARGVDVCTEWNSFERFCSDMGHRPPGHSIERIDNSKGYFPRNCRWATPAEQTANRRTTIWAELNGELVPMSIAARALGVLPATVHYRIRKLGMSVPDALHTRVNRKATLAIIREIK